MSQKKETIDKETGLITADVSNQHSALSTQHSALRLMIVAGEASGDKHGAALATALRQLYPAIEFELFGAGGDEMRAAGVETLVDAREVAIIGVPEIARALGKLYRAYRKLLEAARRLRPAAIVLIDWPDFNMRLARRLHREGFKIVYYISPQVWAWRRYRVRALRRDVDRMLVILPFEEAFYNDAGVAVQYVGHPLAEAVKPSASREAFARKHGLDAARPIIALLPGSRHKEVHYHLPAMLDAARRLGGMRLPIGATAPSHQAASDESQISNLKSQISNPQWVLPLASTINRAQVEAMIDEAILNDANTGVAKANATGANAELAVTIIERDTYNALFHSEFAIVASGTATVETALAGTPMVIIYRGSELNWRLIRPLIKLDTFGMANLIAGRRVVPELMQHDATGERIAREVAAILADPARLEQMKRDLDEVRKRLQAGGGNGAERAARAVMQVASQPA